MNQSFRAIKKKFHHTRRLTEKAIKKYKVVSLTNCRVDCCTEEHQIEDVIKLLIYVIIRPVGGLFSIECAILKCLIEKLFVLSNFLSYLSLEQFRLLYGP